MNRELWTNTLTRTYCPPWPCPSCNAGTMALVPKTLVAEEHVESERARGDENFEPDWIRYSFTAWAQCSNGHCKQKFAIAGSGGVAPEVQEEGEWGWEDFFSPLLCSPMPSIIAIPKKCPAPVAEELLAAFRVFWINPTACASRIRVALELIMNHVGVPKRRKATSGGFYDLTLHARIEAFATKDKIIGPQLMALKWLGNAGSHDGSVVTADLLDAFEILEHALDEIFDRRSAHVTKLAKKLLKKHGH